jgi:ATP-dependent Clp protease adaptor protein ClpS
MNEGERAEEVAAPDRGVAGEGRGEARAPAIRAAKEPGRTDDGRNNTDGNDGTNTGVVVKTRPKTRKPAMYKVLMLNDDYTPMEFVVHVLERFFQKSREEATRIMLHVHRRGVGVCGVFTYEVAETKVTQVMDLARQNQHPLQCTIEKE